MEHVSDQDHRKDPHTPTSTTAGVTGNVRARVCERPIRGHQRTLSHTFLWEAPHPHTHSFFFVSPLRSRLSSHRHTVNTHSRLPTSAQRPISGFEEKKPDTHTRTHTHTHTVTEIGFQGPKYRESVLRCHSNATRTKGCWETGCLQRGARARCRPAADGSVTHKRVCDRVRGRSHTAYSERRC